MTTSDYLTQLQQDKDDLVDNLTTQGITGLTGDETFTELVPEVLNISGGGGADLSIYFKNSITRSYANQLPSYTTMIKTIPQDTTVLGSSLAYAFAKGDIESIPILNTSNVTDMSRMCSECYSLTSIGLINTINVSNFSYTFYCCYSLTSVPQFNLSNATNLQNMFEECIRLENVPIFNIPKATYISNMFKSCSVLTNESLNNILAMCISATSYTGTKTLADLGLTSSSYSASTIQSLSNYQNFLNAGWTIGY